MRLGHGPLLSTRSRFVADRPVERSLAFTPPRCQRVEVLIFVEANAHVTHVMPGLRGLLPQGPAAGRQHDAPRRPPWRVHGEAVAGLTLACSPLVLVLWRDRLHDLRSPVPTGAVRAAGRAEAEMMANHSWRPSARL